MAVIKLWRGEDCAIVEAGSEADVTMRDLGFGDKASKGRAKEPEPEPDSLPDWPLKSTSPAEYIEQHGEDEDPSELIAARLELAHRLVAAGEAG